LRAEDEVARTHGRALFFLISGRPSARAGERWAPPTQARSSAGSVSGV
jgi:hypothetical protein